MARPSNAQLMAEREALRAKIDALTMELNAIIRERDELKFDNLNLQDMLTVYREGHIKDAKKISATAASMLRAKNLAAQGVPCYAKGEYVYHARTNAIIN